MSTIATTDTHSRIIRLLRSRTPQDRTRSTRSLRPSDPNPSSAPVTENQVRPWWLITRREVAVKLRDKNFLISTAILLLILAASFGFQMFMSAKANHIAVGTTSSPEATSLIQRSSQRAHDAGVTLTFDTTTYASADAVTKAVKDGDVEAGLIRQGHGWALISKAQRNALVSTWLQDTAQSEAVQANAIHTGVDLSKLTAGSAVPYTLLQSNGADTRFTAVLAATIFSLLFFVATMVFGSAIANSVIEEKQNRVVEILAAAVPIKDLLIGKILANTILAFSQMVVMAGIGAAGLYATGHSDLIVRVLPGTGWFLLYCLIGFLTLASLWAVVGAMASRAEDVQSTSAPMTALVTMVFFAGIAATGVVQQVCSYVPLLSTIAMPTRVLTGEATWWQAAIGIVLALLTCAVVLRVAERMYRNSVMQVGRRLTLRESYRGIAG